MVSILKRFGLSRRGLPLLLLVLSLTACKKRVEPTWETVAKRWYIMDYPFYQPCDCGSYVDMLPDGTCEALLLCTDEGPERHPRGTWSIDGDNIVIDYPIFGKLGVSRNEGKVTRITDDEMDLTLYVLTIPASVSLSTHNPSAE